MQKLHQKLIQKYQTYNTWHQTKHHNKIHWGVFFIYSFVVFSFILNPLSFTFDSNNSNSSLKVFPSTSQAQTTLEIPLSIEEPAGIARTNEPVSSGIPLPQGTIVNTQEWSLWDGATELPLQVTKLQGRTPWILLDFPVSLNANQKKTLTLKQIPSTFLSSHPLTITEDTNQITVSNKIIKTTLSKTNFNLFEEVWLDKNNNQSFDPGEEIITPQPDNIQIIDSTTKQTFSGKGTPNKIEWEYQGQMRATLRVDGSYQNYPNGLNYTTRLTFYAGRSDVKIEHTLRNSYQLNERHVKVKSATLKIGVGTMSVRATHHGSLSWANVGPQGISFELIPAIVGTINTGTNGGVLLPDMSHHGAILILDFTEGFSETEQTNRAIAVKSPLFALAPSSWYSLNGAFGADRFGTLEDEKKAYQNWGWNWQTSQELSMPPLPDYYVHWGRLAVHDELESDDLWQNLLMYARTGLRGYLDRAIGWAKYFKWQYPYRTDGFEYAWDSDFEGQNNKVARPLIPIPLTSADETYFAADVNRGRIDIRGWGADHAWAGGLIDFYYLTGDVDALEAAIDIAEISERVYGWITPGDCRPDYGGPACMAQWGLRPGARNLLLAIRVWEATQDPRWETLMHHIVQLWLQSPMDWDPRGLYYQTDSSKPGLKYMSSFQITLLAQAFYRYYLLTENQPVKERLIAMSRWVQQFGIHKTVQHSSAFIGMDYPNPGDMWHFFYDEGSTIVDPFYTVSLIDTLAIGYRLTGDKTLLERAKYHWDRGSKGVYGKDYTVRTAGPNEVGRFLNDLDPYPPAKLLYLSNGDLPYVYLLFYDAARNLGEIDTNPPTSPTNLIATAISISQVNLSWNASTDDVGVIGYHVYRGETKIATITTTSYQDGGLSPSSTYTYTVAAFDAAGNVSPQSATVSTATQASPPLGSVVFAVNAGGSAYTANDGTLYQADTYFTGGSTYSTTDTIIGTADNLLYQSERYGNFAYNIPVVNGIYLVTLQFAETYWSVASKRVFDVTIEGTEVISNLDLFNAVGKNVAYDVTMPISVADGILTINFHTDIDNAKVGAIKVSSNGGVGPDTTPPSIPTDLTATAVSSSQISLSWNTSTDNIEVIGYRIFRNGVQIATSNTTSYQNIDLSPNTTYSYAVAAYDTAGNDSPQSASASATTLANTDINLTLLNLLDNTWVKMNPLPTQRCTSTKDLCTKTENTSNPISRPYSGIASGEGKIFYFGGGHCTYQGNDVEIYDIATDKWIQMYTPEYRLCEGGIGYNGEPYGVDGGWGINVASPQFRPQVQHTYQKFDYDPILKKFIGVLAPGTWAFDPTTTAWMPLAGKYATAQQSQFSPHTGTGSGLVIYDIVIQSLVAFSLTGDTRGVYQFNQGDLSWTKVDDVPSEIGIEVYGVHIPTNNTYFISAINYYNGLLPTFWKYQLNSKTWTNISSSVPGELLQSIILKDKELRGTRCLTYDSRTDVVLALTPDLANNTLAVWSYPVGTETWAKMPLGSVFPPTIDCSWNNFSYDPINNVAFMLISQYPEQVQTWAYRYKKASSVSDTQAPTNPTNLTASNVSSSQINLSWTASSDDVGVTGYKIYRCTGSACALTTQIATSATNSYSDTGLTASTAYTYAVSAYDAAGNESAKSSSISATTLAGFKPSDLNQDQKVDQLDFDILKQDWNRTDKPVSDLNQDGIVDSRDLGIMMSEWTR